MAKEIDKGLDDLEDMPEYLVGLWYSPFCKIYHIGGRNRIAELSTYPRAYKDLTPHVYTEDVPFIVTESYLNHRVNGDRFYRDSRGDLFSIGEEATHWIGDRLPGAFPLWLESEDLPFTPNPDEHVFPIDKVPRPILDLSEGGIKVGPVFVKLPEPALAAMREHLPTGKITRERKPQDSDKQIIRILYQRRFR